MRISEQATVKIVLLGAGGTGGYLIPHLYRIAHSINKSIRIIMCDGDVVKEKNLIRQNFVRQDIGHNKAKVLAERMQAHLESQRNMFLTLLRILISSKCC